MARTKLPPALIFKPSKRLMKPKTNNFRTKKRPDKPTQEPIKQTLTRNSKKEVPKTSKNLRSGTAETIDRVPVLHSLIRITLGLESAAGTTRAKKKATER